MVSSSCTFTGSILKQYSPQILLLEIAVTKLVIWKKLEQAKHSHFTSDSSNNNKCCPGYLSCFSKFHFPGMKNSPL